MKLADFMESLPKETPERTGEEKVEFMWDDYHQSAMNSPDVITEDWDDEDWDDDDDDAHVIYVRD
jgi:GTP-binding protein